MIGEFLFILGKNKFLTFFLKKKIEKNFKTLEGTAAASFSSVSKIISTCHDDVINCSSIDLPRWRHQLQQHQTAVQIFFLLAQRLPETRDFPEDLINRIKNNKNIQNSKRWPDWGFFSWRSAGSWEGSAPKSKICSPGTWASPPGRRWSTSWSPRPSGRRNTRPPSWWAEKFGRSSLAPSPDTNIN